MDLKALSARPPGGFIKTLCVMKLTAILVLSTCLTASASGYSQITLSAKNTPLQKVLKEIRQQSGYEFLCPADLLQKAGVVTVNVRNASIDEAVTAVLAGKSLTYTISDKTIVIKEKPTNGKQAEGGPVAIPPVDVTGLVTDQDGKPLAGANVRVLGGAIGTTTDAQGHFRLTNIDENAMLEISYVGHEPQTIRLNSRKNISLSLRRNENKLDELQVIAYGATTRRLNTGNVSTVKSSDISKHPVSNPLAALQGRVPGMIITQNNGVPGGSFSVQIRGQNSIGNGNDPLYVIDGVPYTSKLLLNLGGAITASSGTAANGSAFNFINPSDIESIDVLKDADATAIYGSRGANGVVLITTKKGKAGKTKIDLNVQQGIGKVARKMDLLNTEQYLAMRREAFANDNASPKSGDYDVNGEWDTTSYTDWQKLAIGGSAKYTDAQVSVSGGQSTISYLLSGGYHKETTVFPGDFNDQKASVHFTLMNSSADGKFALTLTGNYVSDNSNLFSDDLTRLIFNSPNTPENLNPDGTVNWANGTWENPYIYQLKKYKSRTNNLISNATVSYQPLPGLTLKSSFGYTNMQVSEISTVPISTISPLAIIRTGNASFVNNNIRSWIIEPQIDYHWVAGKGRLNILLGTTIQQNNNEGQAITGSGYTSDILLESIQAAASVSVFSSTINKYKYNALFGRINYNWDDRYLVNLTGRRDGSSRFGPEKQFHNFFAAGAAWIFSNEHFMRDHLPFISFGKLRASYGTTGSDQVGDYRFMDLYNTTLYPYQGGQGLYPAALFNPDLAWEENRKLEAGLELGFFRDRVLITASYFRNRSSNQLLNYPLPDITGFFSIARNLPATVQNTGAEFTLNTVNVSARNFKWSSAFNITIARNKLIDFPGLENSTYKDKLVIGQPLDIQKVFRLVGVDPQTGLFQFIDGNGNITTTPVTTNDRVAIINLVPEFYGGFQNSFQYGLFQLDLLLQFVKQQGRNFPINKAPGRFGINQPADVLERWGKPGDAALMPQFSQKTSTLAYKSYGYAQNSDWMYADASYIRLKNISLSYRLPEGWKQKLHLQNVRVYVQGQNLFTITGYKGLDPESQSITNLPPLRVITAGIQVVL